MEEVFNFTQGAATLFNTVFQALFAVTWYSYQTWLITGWNGASAPHPTACRLPIPVIGSVARGDQRLSCSTRRSMEPRIEQSSR